MTHERDVEHTLDLWLASGPRQAPDQVVDGVAERIARQPQRAAWRPAVSDRFAPIATGMVGRAAALTVVAAVGLIAVAVVFGPVGRGPAAVPSPVTTVSPRTFQAEVDRLVDPPDTIQVTVLDETGMVVRVIPHPASRDDETPFFGPGGAVPSILVVNPHADVSFSRAIVLWLADPTCDERVTMTLARDGDGLRVVASVISSRRDVPDASGRGPSQSGLDGAACGATYPIGVELDLSEPLSADRFTASLTRVPGD